MAYTKISFNYTLNTSLQVGDRIYFSKAQSGPIISEPQSFGDVVEVYRNSNYIVVFQDTHNWSFAPGDFVFFSKNVTANESSLKGYYADVTFENASNVKSELFAISSEIAVSSK